jgi:hypothetical protein
MQINRCRKSHAWAPLTSLARDNTCLEGKSGRDSWPNLTSRWAIFMKPSSLACGHHCYYMAIAAIRRPLPSTCGHRNHHAPTPSPLAIASFMWPGESPQALPQLLLFNIPLLLLQSPCHCLETYRGSFSGSEHVGNGTTKSLNPPTKICQHLTI